MKAVYCLIGLLAAQAAVAGQVSDVCNVISAHYDTANAATCSQVASSHRYFDAVAVDVCLSIANKYDDANASACVAAIADKEYLNDGAQTCKKLADQYAGAQAVTCLRSGGVSNDHRGPGCMSVLDIRTSLDSALFQLDHNDYWAGRSALNALAVRLQQCQ